MTRCSRKRPRSPPVKYRHGEHHHSRRLVPGLVIPASSAALPPELGNLVLASGDMLAARASVDGVVSAFLSGFTVG